MRFWTTLISAALVVMGLLMLGLPTRMHRLTQADLVQRITNDSGVVEYDFERRMIVRRPRHWTDPWRHDIVSVDMYAPYVLESRQAALVRDVCALPQLRSLSLARFTLTAQDFRKIGGLTLLEDLDLANTNLSDDDLRALQGLKQLWTLRVSNCPITDRGIGTLAHFDQMMHLDLDGTGLTDEGISVLAALPQLRYLDISNTSVSDEGLQRLLSSHTALEIVDATDTQVTLRTAARLMEAHPDTRIDAGVREPHDPEPR